MSESYTRQSSFSNGDVIDAPLFDAEYDQLELAFGEIDGHRHDGTAGGGAAIPFIQKTSNGEDTGIYIDTTNPADPKITFKVLGVNISSIGGDYFGVTSAIRHTPDGEAPVNLSTYLDGLEIAVGDAASDAAAAAISAAQAEAAAAVLGIPIILNDGEDYTITNDMVQTDIICLGDSTITLPTTLTLGHRYSIRVSSKADQEKRCDIPNSNFNIIGDLLTLSPGDGLTLKPGEIVILDVISSTELEII